MINYHFIKKIIKHYWSATRIDVLHSPFVFELYNSCIKGVKSNADFDQVEQLRSALKKDTRILTQQDLGAGSANAGIKKQSVKYFAAQHAKPARLAQIIYRLTDHFKYASLIELGTSLGISACYQASALKKNYESPYIDFSTIEGAAEIAAIAQENFEKLQLEKYIRIYIGNFDEVLPAVLKRYEKLDMAFIDGNHRYEATIKYFELLLPYLHNNSMLIFDDIYWSKGMTKAWNEIKKHPQVTVTIDLFFIGLVFFRKEQAKEHFKLRVW